MLSSVLRSDRAIQRNIAIMRAFVKLRQIMSTHKELTKKLAELELINFIILSIFINNIFSNKE